MLITLNGLLIDFRRKSISRKLQNACIRFCRGEKFFILVAEFEVLLKGLC